MARKVFMSEVDIRKFEQMDEAQIASVIFPLGLAEGAAMFVSLFRSYRIAATVANAAWKVSKEAEAGQISPQAWGEMQRALHLYSPGNFRPFAAELEYGCRLLEELYDHLTQYADDNALACTMMDVLFRRITWMRSQLPTVAP